MIPPAFFRLTRLRGEDALAEAARERLKDTATPSDRSWVVVTAAVLAAIVTVIAAAPMLRSILILGGFGVT